MSQIININTIKTMTKKIVSFSASQESAKQQVHTHTPDKVLCIKYLCVLQESFHYYIHFSCQRAHRGTPIPDHTRYHTYSIHNASVKIFFTNYRLKILAKSNIHISLSLNIEWRKTINYQNKCYSALLEFLVKNNVNNTALKAILKEGQAEKAYQVSLKALNVSLHLVLFTQHLHLKKIVSIEP